MYYWDFVNMKQVPSIVREAIEDIYLMVNEKWDYTDKKSTEKMKEIFEKPEEVLQKLMEMNPVIGNRELQNMEEPEKLLREIENKQKTINRIVTEKMWGGTYRDIMEEDSEEELLEKVIEEKSFMENTENIACLALFVVKMAIYKFCIFDYKKISTSLKKESKISEVLEEWEKFFWTETIAEFDHIIPCEGFNDSLFYKKKHLRDSYYECFTKEGVGEGFWCGFRKGYNRCVEALKIALMDEETVQAVKELQYGGFPNSSQSTNKGGSIKEIQNMRHLLDIMERNLEGKLTEQDKADLKSKAQEWSGDIEKLIHMLADVKN